MQNMNEAFKMLKEKVPGLNDEDKNFSKLEVLQCTISYLQHLYKVCLRILSHSNLTSLRSKIYSVHDQKLENINFLVTF